MPPPPLPVDEPVTVRVPPVFFSPPFVIIKMPSELELLPSSVTVPLVVMVPPSIRNAREEPKAATATADELDVSVKSVPVAAVMLFNPLTKAPGPAVEV